MSGIDWGKHDGWPKDECECRCGAVFKSHSKFVFDDSRSGIISRVPCPVCGHDDEIVRSTSYPEHQIIGRNGL